MGDQVGTQYACKSLRLTRLAPLGLFVLVVYNAGVMSFIPLFASLLLGYLIGRWSHWYLNDKVGNPAWVPHHWLTGMALVIIGLVFPANPYRWYFVAFGAGLFISDLKDFLLMRFFRPDDPGPKRFWHID